MTKLVRKESTNKNNIINDKNSIFKISDNNLIFHNNVFTSQKVVEPDKLEIKIELVIDDKWRLMTSEEVGELYKDD